jgi:hypothetical protein
MSKLWLASAAAVAAMAFAPASFAADVTGTVDVLGHVTGTCSVLGGETTTDTFTGSIDLGELAGADGKLVQQTGTAGPFTVMCNTAAPKVQMSATSLVGETAPADSTYTNVVGYSAHLTLVEAGGSPEVVNATSAVSAPPVSSLTLAHPLSGGSNNLSIAVDTLTSNGAVLTAGGYGSTNSGSGGVITITITPV